MCSRGLDRSADPDFRRQRPFGTLDAADLNDLAWLDFVNPGSPQGRGVEEDVALDFVTGNKAIAAQSVEPFDDSAAERCVDAGIWMKAARPCRRLFIAAGHFDDLNRLTAFIAFYSLAGDARIRQSRPLTKSSETTCMEENIPQPVRCVDESISACRIIPFYAAFQTNNFRVVENFMSQNHNISLA